MRKKSESHKECFWLPFCIESCRVEREGCYMFLYSPLESLQDCVIVRMIWIVMLIGSWCSSCWCHLESTKLVEGREEGSGVVESRNSSFRPWMNQMVVTFFFLYQLLLLIQNVPHKLHFKTPSIENKEQSISANRSLHNLVFNSFQIKPTSRIFNGRISSTFGFHL